MRRIASCAGLVFLASAAARPAPCLAQSTVTAARRAASATELPLGPWGPYTATNLAPSYLANRFKGQLFTFPLVIGQRRAESLLRPAPGPDGKTRLRLQKVAIERRSMATAPMEASDDDRVETAAAEYGNRTARIVDADADGLLWSLRIPFAPAGLAQSVGGSSGGETGWGAGEAAVSFFPAFADPNVDGLLVRVSLHNRSQKAQTWFVDLLGGLSLLSHGFDLKDLHVQVAPDGKASLLEHKNSDAAFAIAADASPYPVRAYTVGNAYFGRDAAVSERDGSGVALPAGRFGGSGSSVTEIARAVGKAPGPSGLWALTRVDEISVGPGETAAVTLCIGVGKETEEARHAAQTLSFAGEDAVIDGKPGPSGAFTRALAEHRSSEPTLGSPAIDRLLAQSFANIPFDNWRRVGAPSRQWAQSALHGAYRPVEGGFIGLGWAAPRPDWAAAQLNAWFLTSGDPDTPVRAPQTVAPINLFALWELYQQTLDRRLLAQFYPFAVRRYHEMLTAGRASANKWLFSWKTGMPEIDRDSDENAAGLPGGAGRTVSPDYSAFVIRSARILRRMAAVLERPATELLEFSTDADAASKAMIASLWDASLQTFVSRPAGAPEGAAIAHGELTALLPLIAGADALSGMQRTALLRRLSDPDLFWSPAGLRSQARGSSLYRPHEPGSGAVAFGTSWLLWKALLDLGEPETARKLAANLLRGYTAAQASIDGCPEALDGDTGLAAGATDVSGDASALLNLYVAYNQPGAATTGWNVLLMDRKYDRATDTLHLVYRPVDHGPGKTLLCALGKPNGVYTLTGDLTGDVTADSTGVITLTTRSGSTQELTIQPSVKP